MIGLFLCTSQGQHPSGGVSHWPSQMRDFKPLIFHILLLRHPGPSTTSYTHNILETNSKWHTLQLLQMIACDVIHLLLSKAKQHLKTYRGQNQYFLQKIASVSTNSFLTFMRHAWLIRYNSNYSHLTSSSVTYSCCTHFDSLCNFPSVSASLLSGSVALLSWKMLVVDQYIKFKDTVLIPVWEY